MSDLQKLKNELVKDELFRKEYEAIQPEMEKTRALLDARIETGDAQAEEHRSIHKKNCTQK